MLATTKWEDWELEFVGEWFNKNTKPSSADRTRYAKSLTDKRVEKVAGKWSKKQRERVMTRYEARLKNWFKNMRQKLRKEEQNRHEASSKTQSSSQTRATLAAYADVYAATNPVEELPTVTRTRRSVFEPGLSPEIRMAAENLLALGRMREVREWIPVLPHNMAGREFHAYEEPQKTYDEYAQAGMKTQYYEESMPSVRSP